MPAKNHRFVGFPESKGSLDACLRALKERGAHVLDFYRRDGQWVFKLSVPVVCTVPGANATVTL